MTGEKGKKRFSMEQIIVGTIVLSLAVFWVAVSILGITNLSTALQKEYTNSTYHMADTAVTLVNGDHIDAYLQGEERGEFDWTQDALDKYCEKMYLSLVYVIKVDESDYGSFVSVFNSVNNEVGNTSYEAWELGHPRETTNEEYQQKYRALYEKTSTHETVYRLRPDDGSKPHITTMVPVSGSDGKVTALLCLQRPFREQVETRRPYLITISIAALLIAAIAAAFAAAYIRKGIVKPLRKVTKEAVRFSKENTRGEPLREVSRVMEIADLAESIDTMETDMVRYMDNLTDITAERERMLAELSFASSIQESALPNVFPAFPDIMDFDIFATMNPAREVGGDFYNFFLIDDDHLVMAIGDASGKGIPGALFMMETNIAISNRAKMGGTPGEILTFVNDSICEHNHAEMFVTVWLGILEISTGKVIEANAGHEYPAIYRKGGIFEAHKTKHGIVIGAMEGVRYRDHEFRLEPGDKLFVYTDGVPEATDRELRMFTLDRLLSTLNKYRDGTPKEILNGVQGSIREFVSDADQFDDMTMLCLEIKEKK